MPRCTQFCVEMPNKAAYMCSLHTLRCAVKQGLSRFATLHAVLCRDALHGACFCEVRCRTPKAKQFLGEPLPCPMRLVSYRSSHAASQPVLAQPVLRVLYLHFKVATLQPELETCTSRTILALQSCDFPASAGNLHTLRTRLVLQSCNSPARAGTTKLRFSS